MISETEKNKRILKNSLLLYIRLLLTMAIGLYTSRVVLRILGVEDYGVYNVVAGFVSMFSLLTGSLSNSISRFLTFTLGKGNQEKLDQIFSTSVLVQIVLAIFVVLALEIFGLWFFNNKLNIPNDRLVAANWVYQLSVLAFAINLISIPYNACIIAHEKMGAFAYIGIIEVSLKLLIVFSLSLFPHDKLIIYALLLVAVSISIRLIYGWYCKRKFRECRRLKIHLDKTLLKEMTEFAGWNFLGNASTILGTQGTNVLMNIFFGVVVNAARGVTNQIETVVKQFVSNITTAINPQITKSYAEGNFEYMNVLIRKSAKYSVCLILLFAVPFWFEAENILKLWLGNVPAHANVFLRLALLGIVIDMSGNSLAIAVWSSGKIKKYYIYIGLIGLLVLPVTYVLYRFNFPAYYSYVSYIAVYSIIQIVRLFIAKSEIPFDITLYVKDVYLRSAIVALVSVLFSLIPYTLIQQECLTKSIVIVLISIASVACSTYFWGLDCSERRFVIAKFKKFFRMT